MAEIPRAYLDRYNQLVNGVVEKTIATVRAQLAAVGITDPDLIYDVVKNTLRASDSAVAEIDRQFYQTLRKLIVGDEGYFDLETGITWSDEDLEKALDKAYEACNIEGVFSMDALNEELSKLISTILAQSSKTHMIEYGERDSKKPRYARVPSGAETCAWCWSLAGHGFYYMSKETASHSHPNCDCVIVCSWDEDTVEGYDPEWYADKFREAKADLESGNISDELYERIMHNAMSTPGYSTGWNGVLAVMREKYGLK